MKIVVTIMFDTTCVQLHQRPITTASIINLYLTLYCRRAGGAAGDDVPGGGGAPRVQDEGPQPRPAHSLLQQHPPAVPASSQVSSGHFWCDTFCVFLPFIRRSESSQRQRRHNRKAISANNGLTHKVYGSEKKIKVDAENGIHANGNINESCT